MKHNSCNLRFVLSMSMKNFCCGENGIGVRRLDLPDFAGDNLWGRLVPSGGWG
jgi:hypothetical protein